MQSLKDICFQWKKQQPKNTHKKEPLGHYTFCHGWHHGQLNIVIITNLHDIPCAMQCSGMVNLHFKTTLNITKA